MSEIQTADAGQCFTQEQVDKIIASRISRERAAFEGYDTLRGVLDALRTAGVLKSASVKGMAAELTELIKTREEGQSEAAGKEPSIEDAALTSVQPTMEDCTAEIISAVPSVPETTEAAGYPEPREERVRRALAFSSYAAQSASSGLPLDVLYENFERLYSIITGGSEHINGTHDATSSETVRSVRRELAGTAHGASRAQSDYMLTPRQMELARSAGMSCREYAALLLEARSEKQEARKRHA
ncbi:MAG: hypothetical protein AB9835_12825 [Eubacteriales bacterium]